ncbi:hypothetical protein GDO86_012529 [Hymenochirus boettgeri]|uniref:G-protein coupled receptors family 1 profile domain-containing protein n=1 Tax=Hymenochirus boettgeri TaxID=247094 RepID=A0A8T2IRH8_9PIPI|nr:hypothetical protein GDO86_012527 [Hymenochirus boettgeri]KAG8434189.1 hypothetical protein GDO86_012529 [Hymenochirus boettgeri]
MYSNENQTFLSDFTLLGFTERYVALSLLLAAIYTLILMGNLAILTIIHIDCHLKTPMYFFLSCLYVAICNPLRYPTIMNKKLCLHLVGGSWFCGFLNSVLHTLMTSRLSFCEIRYVNHFFCDVPALLKASCTDTQSSQLLLYIVNIFLGMTPFVFVIISYIRIISTILKIGSSAGMKKAFSTCSSHLIVVTVFYCNAIKALSPKLYHF